MNSCRLFSKVTSSFVFDNDMRISSVVNLDRKMFFGIRPIIGKTISEVLHENNITQADELLNGLNRAWHGKRNSCFEYLSTYEDGMQIYVAASIEYSCQTGFTLYLSNLNSCHSNTSKGGLEMCRNHNSLFENISIALIVFDNDGSLLDLNQAAMKQVGINDKKSVIGISLFDNPYIDESIKTRLVAGENVVVRIDYDYNIIKDHNQSTSNSVRVIEVTISVVRKADGSIDKYIAVPIDITEYIGLQNKYEDLYKQTMTILNAIQIGIAIHSNDGTLLYMNKCCEEIFRENIETLIEQRYNLFESRDLNEEILEAVKNGVPINTRISYLIDSNYPDSPDNNIYVEFCGCPIKNTNEELERYIFIVNDVTESVRTQDMLRANHDKIEMAIKSADIMLWEYDVPTKLFFSNNESLNGYDNTKPITPEQYIESIHDDDKHKMVDAISRMNKGEAFSFELDGKVKINIDLDWQFCSINCAPFKRDINGRVIKYVGTRKNNNELHSSKQFQNKILNNIPIPIHIKDVENDFKYLFCNDESMRMFGSSVEKTIYDIMDVEEVERIQKTDYETYITGKPYTGVERILLKDGRVYDTIVRKSIISDGGRNLLLTSRWDQGLQNDLMRRSKLLTITMEAMNAFTWFFDHNKNRISFGDGFNKIGIKSTDINTLDKYIERIHHEDKKLFSDSISELIKNEKGVWNVDYRLDLNNDGDYKWWQTRGMFEETIVNDDSYKYMFGMTINIDEHKKTEINLTKSKEELNSWINRNELILNNSNSGLVYISTDYVVQWENLSTCFASLSYEAYKQGELCYKSARNRNSPCDDCVMQRAVKSSQVENITFSLDNDHSVEVYATPVFDEQNGISGIVIRVDDVTDRERMIAELRKAKLQAEQSDKLKSAFLANMSHEIRTPLNAIVGFSEMLIHCSEEEKEEYMQIISTNNGLLLKLINDILDLSKIEAGSVEFKNEVFNLSTYFDDLSSSMRQRVNSENVRLITVNPYKNCNVILDCNRVAQILTNYVTNAIKYTPKGFIEMGYECRVNGIYLYVKDSGIGIPEEKTDKVFHRFEKLDDFAQGTGLGLSICKALVESMGGEVGFESKYGDGSIFWAELPCECTIDGIEAGLSREIALESDHPNVKKQISSDDVNRRKVILVAEDILSNFQLLSAMLSKQFDLIHAENGLIAIDILKDRHIDLVFMDMKMPVMDGMTATAKIREFDTHLPIVALTAHAFDSDREAAINIGCNDYLVKPINKAQIMAVLRKYDVI